MGDGDLRAPYAGGNARGLLARLLIRRRVRPSVGVDDWARRWVQINGADPAPVVDAVAAGVTRRAWGPDVVFHPVRGGGHTWPGAATWIPPHLGRTSRTFSATEAILAFFADHASG